MRCLCLGIVLLVGLVPATSGQDAGVERLPTISLVLPAGFASETVQISYFMTGRFGGYGGFVRPEKGRPTYDIAASLDQIPAANMKVVAYLPGCEIVAYEISVQGTTVERPLSCKPLGWISLHGQISPVSTTREQPTQVEVVYLARWAHQFFGIAEGPVTTISLGTVVPDENGVFEIRLPDLYRQPAVRDGEFQLTLRHGSGGNIIAFLKPVDAGAEPRSLNVRPSYLPVVLFTVERQ
jgi:hypothetical protein